MYTGLKNETEISNLPGKSDETAKFYPDKADMLLNPVCSAATIAGTA